jgi:hypothetical protein
MDFSLRIDPVSNGFRAEIWDPLDLDGPPIATAVGATRDAAVAAVFATVTFDNEEHDHE